MRTRYQRRWSVGPDTFSVTNPAESPYYSDFGIEPVNLLRMSLPAVTRIEFRASRKEHLCGRWAEATGELKQAAENRIDEEKANKHRPIGPLHHVYYQVALGPQVTYHVPYHPRRDLLGAEADAVIQQDINLVFHDDDDPGFEASLALQGSGNYSFIDPNRNDPNEIGLGKFATQDQRQIQLGTFFPNFLGVKNLTFGVFIQFAGSRTYQYDPSTRSPQFSYSKVAALGLGLNYQLNDTLSLGFQPTIGINEGATTTVDVGGFVFIQQQADILK